MSGNYLAKVTIDINAPKSKVWEALTNPQLIKQYLFGTQGTTDWQVGSPIKYTGTWEGGSYEDKRVVLENEPEKLLNKSSSARPIRNWRSWSQGTHRLLGPTPRDRPGVVEKYGVRPASIPDWLALVGDAADGISPESRLGGLNPVPLY